MMARLVKFDTRVVAAYNFSTKEWEYLPAKPDGVVFINPDRVEYISPTPCGDVVYLHFGGASDEDNSVFLRQSLDSVVGLLEEA